MLLLLTMLAQAVVIEPAAPPEPGRDLVLSSVEQFAVFADRDSIERQDEIVTLRALQVAEEGFRAGGRPYAGGWSNWRFDCEAVTADRLDFASLAEDGTEGPATPDAIPPSPVGSEGEIAELARIACGAPAADAVTASSLEEALSLGRARLAEQKAAAPDRLTDRRR